jgi:hypothetical protein
VVRTVNEKSACAHPAEGFAAPRALVAHAKGGLVYEDLDGSDLARQARQYGS